MERDSTGLQERFDEVEALVGGGGQGGGENGAFFFGIGEAA